MLDAYEESPESCKGLRFEMRIKLCASLLVSPVDEAVRMFVDHRNKLFQSMLVWEMPLNPTL
jgi:hypothetical protein